MTPPPTSLAKDIPAPFIALPAPMGYAVEQAGMLALFVSGIALVAASGPSLLMTVLKAIGSYLGPIALLFA